MLIKIMNFIADEKTATVKRISKQFVIDILALEPMLDFLVVKKKIEKKIKSMPCKTSCGKCENITYYSTL